MAYDPKNRPTSPHLSIYRPQITTVLSISHRMTGMGLYAGALLLAAWIGSAAYSAPCFKAIHGFMGAWYGQLFLLGWLLAFYYHLANGIRHMWWDTGRGFDLKEVTRSGWTVVIFAIALTAATWWVAHQPMVGGLDHARTAVAE